MKIYGALKKFHDKPLQWWVELKYSSSLVNFSQGKKQKKKKKRRSFVNFVG
jgi:hypothetical protein